MARIRNHPTERIVMNRRSYCLIMLLACSTFTGVSAQIDPDPAPAWSVRMAESVMTRTPLLSEKWHYEVGVMLKAFEKLWQRTGDVRYFEFIRSNMDSFVMADGSIRTYSMDEYNLDQINAGKLLFPLYDQTGEERYRQAIEVLRDQLRSHPRTSEGGFWHKKIYPYQLWLDGVYMAGPFLTQYGAAFGDPEALDEVVHEILLVARYTRDPATGLMYHGWDEKREQIWADSVSGLSPHFWGRAMGWYAMALVDVLDFLPETHESRNDLIANLRQLAAAVSNVQDPVTGVWYQILDMPANEGNYLEASASSMFVYSLAKAVRKGYIDRAYDKVARRGYRGILKEFVSVEEDLVSLNRICSVAGLGGAQQRDGSFSYYMSEPISSNDPKGVGPFIMASLEIERMDGR
ncbi:MAG TPA: glycoside hydrolase family 88 protein [Rhodothermales bacterium]|nr:glycoside hydrolase family 88 protein [Rhodothermales bacterium]